MRFLVVEQHPVAKGLAGGRFRQGADKELTEGLCRKVAREARVEVTGCQELPSSRAGSSSYRLSLRSALPGHQGGGYAEGTIVIQVVP